MIIILCMVITVVVNEIKVLVVFSSELLKDNILYYNDPTKVLNLGSQLKTKNQS